MMIHFPCLQPAGELCPLPSHSLASSSENKTAHMPLIVISHMQIFSDFCIIKFSQPLFLQPCLRVNGASGQEKCAEWDRMALANIGAYSYEYPL